MPDSPAEVLLNEIFPVIFVLPYTAKVYALAPTFVLVPIPT